MKLPGPSRSAAFIAVLAVATLGACSDDAVDDADDADDAVSNVLVDDDFPGDALDATCNRLDATEGDDDVARASEVLAALVDIGGEEAAVETLRQATVDRCPEWTEAVTSAIGG